MSKKKVAKSGLTERAGDFAKNIWLAGLGAYGEAYDEMTNQQKSIKELPLLFKELVEKGAGIESSDPPAASSKRSGKKRSKTQSTLSAGKSLLEGESLEQRIRRMREGLNLNWPSTQPASEIQQLEAKIDRLADELASIKKLLSAQLLSTAKKTSPRKAKAVSKSVSKKAVQKKPSTTKAKATKTTAKKVLKTKQTVKKPVRKKS